MLRRFLTLAIHVTPIVLATLMGWGCDDWRGFFNNPARAGVLVAVIAGAGLVSLLRVDLQPLRRGTSPTRHQTLTLAALAVAALSLIWFLPFADRRQILTLAHNQSLRYLGLALCCCGIAVRATALANLGPQFSAYVTLQDNHQLVESGIYGFIRHPLYLSLLLAAPGFALVFNSLLTAPILVATCGFVTSRIRQEENLLESRFGAQFREYRRRTGALLPPAA